MWSVFILGELWSLVTRTISQFINYHNVIRVSKPEAAFLLAENYSGM